MKTYTVLGPDPQETDAYRIDVLGGPVTRENAYFLYLVDAFPDLAEGETSAPLIFKGCGTTQSHCIRRSKSDD